MKIFDFSNGRIENQIGESRRPQFCSGNPIRDGYFVCFVTPQSRDSEWTLQVSVGWGSPDKQTLITPQQFGVEAIAFSVGCISSGNDRGTWVWHVVATDNWIDTAMRHGLVAPRTKTAQVAA